MTTPGDDSDDKSYGFNSSNGTLDLIQNLVGEATSRKPSLTIPGGNSQDESTGFVNNVQSRDMLLSFGAMDASHDLSSTTRTGKRRRGPSLELTLAPPGIKNPKKKFYKSKLPPLPNPPPDLPRDFKEHIKSLEGKEVKLVMQKVLTCSDLSSRLARLLLPENQIMRGVSFLRTGECDELHKNNGKDIVVDVISSNLKKKSLKFKLWSMKKKARVVGRPEPEPTNVYVLQGGWVGFASENKLKENDRVQLWSFRANDKTRRDSLKFAIVKLKGDDEDHEGDDDEAVIHPE